MQPAYRRRDAPVAPGDAAAAQTRANADEFKLHFPIPKDRTMRRIALTQLALIIISPAACAGNVIVRRLSSNSDHSSVSVLSSPDTVYELLSIALGIAGVLSLIGIFLVSFVHSAVLARRYGWRAITDPIEARRVAMREGLLDLRTVANPEHPNSTYTTDHLPNPRRRKISRPLR